MANAKHLLQGIGSQLTVKTWPQTRLKRQVIFSLTDLLGNVTSSLFFIYLLIICNICFSFNRWNSRTFSWIQRFGLC